MTLQGQDVVHHPRPSWSVYMLGAEPQVDLFSTACELRTEPLAEFDHRGYNQAGTMP